MGAFERVCRWGRRNPGWATMFGTVAALLLVIAIGASVGVVQMRQALAESERNLDRARQAERDTEVKLIDTLVARARANCLGGRPGQRFASLAILADATRRARRLGLPPERFFDLRNAAILALAVPDLYVEQTWAGFPEGSAAVDFDDDLAVYARVDSQGNCEVRQVAGDELLHLLPSPGTPMTRKEEAPTPYLRPDGRFVAIRRWRASMQLEFYRIDGAKPKQLLTAENVSWVDYHPNGRQAGVTGGGAQPGGVPLPPLFAGRHATGDPDQGSGSGHSRLGPVCHPPSAEGPRPRLGRPRLPSRVRPDPGPPANRGDARAIIVIAGRSGYVWAPEGGGRGHRSLR